MKANSSLVLPARIENFQAFMDGAKETAATAGLAPDQLFKLELAVEEAVVNIINYAYEGGEGEIRIMCSSDDRGTFVMEITDNGRPFDLTAIPPPDLTADVPSRKIGGLGIHFIKTLMDSVSYRREGEKNVLELKISLASQDL